MWWRRALRAGSPRPGTRTSGAPTRTRRRLPRVGVFRLRCRGIHGHCDHGYCSRRTPPRGNRRRGQTLLPCRVTAPPDRWPSRRAPATRRAPLHWLSWLRHGFLPPVLRVRPGTTYAQAMKVADTPVRSRAGGDAGVAPAAQRPAADTGPGARFRRRAGRADGGPRRGGRGPGRPRASRTGPRRSGSRRTRSRSPRRPTGTGPRPAPPGCWCCTTRPARTDGPGRSAWWPRCRRTWKRRWRPTRCSVRWAGPG